MLQLDLSAFAGWRWVTASFISLKATSAEVAPHLKNKQKRAAFPDTDSH